MDREALLAMLVSRYGLIAGEAGLTVLDAPDGFGPVLDRVQEWIDTDPLLDPVWIEPLARYAALDYLADRLSGQTDVSMRGESYRVNQLFTNVLKLLEAAKAQVAWFVDPVAPGSSSGDIPVATPYAVIVDGPTW